MRFCYADPPYIGMSHFYKDHPDYAGEVDHHQLLTTLTETYSDGWALSCTSTTLKQILEMKECPADVRVMAWVKPFASFKPGVGVAYAWEPVVVRGGRKRERGELTVRDWVSANITLHKGLVGVKPDTFCYWLFDVLGIEAEDTLDDLFPGSGAVTKALEVWRRQLTLEWTV